MSEPLSDPVAILNVFSFLNWRRGNQCDQEIYKRQTGDSRKRLESLQVAWGHTSDHWRDRNAHQVEEEMLRPIGEEVTKALPAISHMAQLFSQAVRELEE